MATLPSRIRQNVIKIQIGEWVSSQFQWYSIVYVVSIIVVGPGPILASSGHQHIATVCQPHGKWQAAASRYYHSLATHDRAWRMCYWWPLGGNVWQSWPMCDLCLPCTHSLTCLSFVQHKTWYLELRYLQIVIVNCKNICKLIDVILLFDICSIVHLTLN